MSDRHICRMSTHLCCVCLYWKYKHITHLLTVDVCVLHECMNISRVHIVVMVIFLFVYEIGPREYEHITHTLPNLFIPWNKISKYVSIRTFSAPRWEDSRAYIKSGSENRHTIRIYWQLKCVFSMYIRIFKTRDGSHGRTPAHLPNWAWRIRTQYTYNDNQNVWSPYVYEYPQRTDGSHCKIPALLRKRPLKIQTEYAYTDN